MNDDRADVAAIRAEPDARKRSEMTGAFIASKEVLIRILVEKAAKAEKTQADAEDLMQAGRDGVRRALETWDHEKGALSTYAGLWIKNRVQKVARSAQPIALPRIHLTGAERSRVLSALSRDPSATAEALGVPLNVLEQVKASFGLRFTSIDLFGDSEAEDAPSRRRKIEQRLSESTEPEDGIESAMDARSGAKRLADAVGAFMLAARAEADDVVAFVARLLGSPPPYAAAMPKTKTVRPEPSPPRDRPCPPMLPRPTRLRSLLPTRRAKSDEPLPPNASGPWLPKRRPQSPRRRLPLSPRPTAIRCANDSVGSFGSPTISESSRPKIARIFARSSRTLLRAA